MAKTPKAHQGRPGPRGPKGDRGPIGLRGRKGEHGDVGERGEAAPRDHRYERLAAQVEAISHELKVQFERFAQIQQQLDEVAHALKQQSAAQRALSNERAPATRQSN